jgi:hypothetical protein
MISTFSMLTGLRMTQTVEFMHQMKVATGSRYGILVDKNAGF